MEHTKRFFLESAECLVLGSSQILLMTVGPEKTLLISTKVESDPNIRSLATLNKVKFQSRR